jgi:pyocin large subunit-like protein
MTVGSLLAPYAKGAPVAGGSGGSILHFADGCKWLDHFTRHGPKLGFQTVQDYLAGARNLFAGGSDVQTFVRSNGDILFFRASKGEFGVLASDGLTIRTYFIPNNPSNYWLTQLSKG